MAIEKTPKAPSLTDLSDLMLEEETSGDAPYVETEYDDGSIEIDYSEEAVNAALMEGVPNPSDDHYENLAEKITDDSVINMLGQNVLERYQNDKSSVSKWMDTISTGISLLGIEVKETNDPFPGACSAHHPLILESAVKFQAKASNELFNSKGPVKTVVIGDVDPKKEAQAMRVRNHMNYQIMHQMDEYFDEMETLLFYLPIVGSGFKKTYYDQTLDRPVSKFVPVDQFITNYYTSSLKTSPCYTHVITRTLNDIKKDIANGLYRDVDLKNFGRTEYTQLQSSIDDQTGVHAASDDEVMTLLEQYCYEEIDEDSEYDSKSGIALPYVITVEAETGAVLSIRRNWKDDDETKSANCPFTHYKFVPGMGFYGLGYIHLLGNLQMSLTAVMRSLIDSGSFANLQGGFVDKRLRIRSNDGPIAPGEFKEVEAGGIDLEKAFKLLPFKEPSPTLLQMYQFVEERAQKFADSTEQVIADSTNYGPVGTTMALLEASTKFFSGVHKRLHKAQKHEFSLLAALNYEFLEDSVTFEAVGKSFNVTRDDYDGRVDVVPVSDPNMGSQAQKLSQAQAIYQAAIQMPQIHDMKAISRYYYSSIGVDEVLVDKFVTLDEQPQELDPLSDISMAQQGKPIKAFPTQDHQAHIQVKSAFLQDPQSGANPMMAAIAPIIQANIQEHQILQFQKSIQGTTGQAQSPDPLVAQAAQQVSQTNQRLAELEAQGPDTARAKLAEAEVQRAMNESIKLQSDLDQQAYQRNLDAMKLELDKYKTDTQLVIAQMQMQNDKLMTELKETTALIKDAAKIEAQALSQDKQMKVQDKQLAAKDKPKKPKKD